MQSACRGRARGCSCLRLHWWCCRQQQHQRQVSLQWLLPAARSCQQVLEPGPAVAQWPCAAAHLLLRSRQRVLRCELQGAAGLWTAPGWQDWQPVWGPEQVEETCQVLQQRLQQLQPQHLQRLRQMWHLQSLHFSCLAPHCRQRQTVKRWGCCLWWCLRLQRGLLQAPAADPAWRVVARSGWV